MLNKYFFYMKFIIKLMQTSDCAETTIKTLEQDQKSQATELLDYYLDPEIINRIQNIIKEIGLTLDSPQTYRYCPKLDKEAKKIDISILKGALQKMLQSVEKVAGRQAIIILGKTGSGKSTLIHFLAGKKLLTESAAKQKDQKIQMESQQDQEDDNEYLQEFILVPKQELPGFKVGHSHSSQTSVMNVLQYDGQAVVDTVGLMDTKGEIYDIGNAVSLQKAFSKAKTLRFVLVISESTIKDPRGGQLRQLVSQFLGFLPQIQIQKLLSSITVVISRCQTKPTDLRNRLKQTSEAKDQSNANVLKFIEQISLKLKKEGSLNFIGLGTKKKMTDSQQGQNWMNRIKNSKRIQGMGKQFRLSLKKDAISYLQQKNAQFNKQIRTLAIKHYFQDLRQYLSQMKYLRENIDLEIINSNNEDCVNCINHQFLSLKKQYMRDLDLYMSLSGQLSDEGVEHLKCSLQDIKSAEELSHFKGYNFDKSITFGSACDYMVDKMQGISKYIEENLDNIQGMYIIMLKMEKLYSKFGNYIKNVESFYLKFSKYFVGLISQKVQVIKIKIKDGNYRQIAKPFKFIIQIKTIANQFFKIDMAKIIENLKNLAIQSIKRRFKVSLESTLLQISVKNMGKLYKEYKNWRSILEQANVKDLLGENTFTEISNLIKKSINQNLDNKMKQIKQLIRQKRFEQLEQPILTYKSLRQIDNQYASRTSQEYFLVIGKFNLEIMGQSKEILQNSIRKINLGTIGEQETYILKQKMNKIKKMEWLEKIIGKGSIIQIYNNVVGILLKESKALKQDLANLINIEMNEITDMLQPALDLDSSFQSQLKSIKISRISRGKSNNFTRVNSSMNFLKNISEINEDLSKIFNQAKQEIFKIQMQKIELLNLIISQENIKNIYKSQIDELVIRLFYIKEIKYASLPQIQQTFLSVSNKIGNYFFDNLKQLQKSQLKSEQFKNNAEILLNVFLKLESITGILKKYKIDINQKRKSFYRLLEQKFEEFIQNIKTLMTERKLEDSKQMIQILRKYKISEINDLMGNKLKLKYQQLIESYEKCIIDIPKQIEKSFSQQKYSDLAIFLKEYEKAKSQKAYAKIINNISGIIQNQFQNIVDDIFSLNAGGNVDYAKLNKNLKKFLSYSKIQEFVKEINFEKKRATIAKDIRLYYQKLLGDVKGKIEKLKFKNVKAEIDRFNKVTSIITMGISDEEFKLNQVDIKNDFIDFKVQQILQKNLKIGQFSSYLHLYEKIKVLDQQYQSDNSQQLKKKLVSKMTSICAGLEQNAEKAASLQDLDSIQKTLKLIKNDINQTIKTKAQFSNLSTLILQTEEKIQNYASTFLHSSKYNLQYLERLRTRDPKSYGKIIQELKNQFQSQANKIEDSKSKSDYKRLYEGFKSFEKFVPVDKLIKSLKYKSPSQFKVNVQKQIREQYEKAFAKVKRYFEIKRFDSLVDLKNLLNLNISSKGTISKQKIQVINCQIVRFLAQQIPDIGQNAPLDAQLKKINVLKKHSSLIQLFKNYITELQQVFTISDKSDVIAYLSNIKLAGQYEKDVYDKIRKLPIFIIQLWNKFHYRDISNKLIEVKNMGTYDAMVAFQDLNILLKKLLTQQGQKIRIKINEQDFKGVNENLNNISLAQNEMKGVLGLDDTKMQHKTIIKEVSQKIQKQIVSIALNKLQNKEMSQVVAKIMELKKWTDNIPILQSKIEQKVSKVLTKAKQKNLTGQLAAAVQKVVSDPSSKNTDVSLCNQILHRYSKQLSVPRIMPKLRMTITDAIQKFNGQDKKMINKIQLRKAYDIFQQQYQKQKDCYIAKGGKQYIEKNLESIKN